MSAGTVGSAPREKRLSAYQRGYTKRWAAYSKAWKQQHPLCGERADGQLHPDDSRCARAGRITATRVTDHIKPHRGDEVLFWDPSNHQSLCETCHNAKSQREGQRGGGDRIPVTDRRETDRKSVV